MSIPRRTLAEAVPIALADLPRLGIEPFVVAAIASDFGADNARAIGGHAAEPACPPSPPSGTASRHDRSDADGAPPHPDHGGTRDQRGAYPAACREVDAALRNLRVRVLLVRWRLRYRALLRTRRWLAAAERRERCR